jgi:hypothetical protein
MWPRRITWMTSLEPAHRWIRDRYTQNKPPVSIMFENRAELSPAVSADRRPLLRATLLAFVSAVVSWLLLSDLADPRAAAAAIPAVVILLAPLFAPLGGGLRDNATGLALWCLLCAATALILLALIGPAAVQGQLLAVSIGMCLALLVVSHAGLLALFMIMGEGRQQHERRELASWGIVGVLVVLGATPVWLAPLAQALNGSAVVANLAVSFSPLMHLAAATGSDLLRTDWFYRYSSIASLHFAYPTVGTALLAYTFICMAALLAALAAVRRAGEPAFRSTRKTKGEIQL